jgi:hypothetical protein
MSAALINIINCFIGVFFISQVMPINNFVCAIIIIVVLYLYFDCYKGFKNVSLINNCLTNIFFNKLLTSPRTLEITDEYFRINQRKQLKVYLIIIKFSVANRKK